MLSLLRKAASGTLLLMLAACGGGGGGSSGGGVVPPAAMADWTYMVYIAGDNNLSSAAIDDINEMEQAGSSDRVNIVVQAEFSDRHTPYVPGISKSAARARDGIDIAIPGVSVSPTFRGRITKDSDASWISSNLSSLGANLDMGKPQTLTDFIIWSKQQYPARNYALVLWSHGDGWKVRRSTGGVVNRGALADDSSGSFMALPDIAGAIRNAGVNLQILNFDACLMGMYEVAHTFVGLSEYLVASEEVEPGDGDDYQSVLTVLKGSPQLTPLELSKQITRTFRGSYVADPNFRDDAVTKSVTRLSAVPALQDAIESLAAYLSAHMTEHRIAVQAARSGSTAYANDHSHDLWDFLSKLEAQPSVMADGTLGSLIGAVKLAHMDAVVDNRVYAVDPLSPISRSRGLAIFLPSNSQITQDDLSLYEGQSSNLYGRTHWRDFINTLVTGDPGSLLERTTGNFSFAIRWDDPAVDLDLYISEPEKLVAPYINQQTNNGYFTEDSGASGLPMEAYVAADQVQKGDYEVFVNYYAGDKPTTVDLYYADADTPETKVDSRVMPVSGLPYAPLDSHPLNDAQIAANGYADWWFPGGITRNMAGKAALSQAYRLPDGKRVIVNFKERRAKLKRLALQRPKGVTAK